MVSIKSMFTSQRALEIFQCEKGHGTLNLKNKSGHPNASPPAYSSLNLNSSSSYQDECCRHNHRVQAELSSDAG
jgi:hypothetical protein